MSSYLRITACVLVSVIFFISSSVNANPFESLVMPGEVIDGHKKLESDCSNCHIIFSKGGQDKLCLDCHKKIRKDLKQILGFHGKNKAIRTASCKTCHTEHKGRNADIIKLEKAIFNHDETDFKLRGKHKVVECTDCHEKNKKYREVKSQCQSCHIKESPHKKAKAKKGLFKKCQDCHGVVGWLLRINNILRRSAKPEQPVIEQVKFGPYQFFVRKRQLMKSGDPIRLTDREQEIMVAFAEKSGGTVARHELLGEDMDAGERKIDVQINRLRRKIEVDPSDPKWLQTVRGIGYKLFID